ncbi:MAG: hypothetical protein KZQ70_14465 [gamma proteobacterium symbiont of Lucinoma myriamae]|nr:hypothetical protein [gamma proteobacterium symbiont of Lucinoma myriamae]
MEIAKLEAGKMELDIQHYNISDLLIKCQDELKAKLEEQHLIYSSIRHKLYPPIFIMIVYIKWS